MYNSEELHSEKKKGSRCLCQPQKDTTAQESEEMGARREKGERWEEGILLTLFLTHLGERPEDDP